MGSGNTIRAGIKLDGEQQFKTAVKNINNELRRLQTETKQVAEDFRGEANSMAALEAKQRVLNKTIAQSEAKEKALSQALENAKKTRDRVKTGLDAVRKAYDAEKKKLDEMKKVGNASDATMKKQEKTVREYSKALKDGENNLAKSETRISNWERQLATAHLSTTRFKNDLKDVSKYLEESKNSTDHCAQSIDEYGKKIKSANKNAPQEIGSTADAVNTLASAIVAAGVAQKVEDIERAFLQCVEASGEFKTGISKIMTIADKTAATSDSMSSAILDMSSKTGKSAVDLAESTYQAISASVNTADAVQFVGNAAKLATGGFTDQTTAVDTLTTVINAYGKSASDASHISDVLIETQNKGKTTVNDLGAVLGQVIPSAASAGVSFENLSAAMAIVTKNGVQTDIAGTSLRAMFTELSKSSSTVSKTLRSETGQSFSELMASGVSLGDVLNILLESCNGNVEAFKNLFGNVRSQSAAYYLATEGASAFDDELKTMQTTAGQTEAAFSEMANSPEYVNQQFSNAIQNLKIGIGQGLAPVISQIKKTGTGAFEWATDFVKKYPGVVQAFAAVATALGGVAVSITGLAAVITVINQIKTALGPLLTSITSITALGVPVVGIVAGLVGLSGVLGVMAANATAADRADKKMGETISATTETIRKNMNDRKTSSDSYAVKAQQIAQDQATAKKNLADADARLKKAEKDLADAQKNANAGLGSAQFDKKKKTVDDAKKGYEDAKKAVSDLSDEYDKNKTEAEKNGESISMASDAAKQYAAVMGDDVESINDETAETFQKLKDSIDGAIEGFGKFSGGDKMSADDIIKNLESQKKGLEQYSKDMRAISKRTGEGMTTEIYSYLEQMGPQSANIIHSMANMNGDEFQRMCDLIRGKIGDGVTSWGDTAAKKTENAKNKIDNAAKSNAAKNKGRNKKQNQTAQQGSVDGAKSAKSKIKKAVKENDNAARSNAAKNKGHNKKQNQTAQQGSVDGAKSARAKIKKATKENDNATKSNASKNKSYNDKQAKRGTDVSETIRKNKSKNQKAMNDSLKLEVKPGKSKFKKSGSELGDSTARGLRSKKGHVTNAAKSIVSGGPGAIRSRRGAFQSAGAYVGAGVASGLRSQVGSVTSAANAIVTQAERAMRAKMQIKSPSRRIKKRVGVPMGQAVWVGIASETNNAKKAGSKYVSDVFQSISSEARRGSSGVSRSFSVALRKQLKSGVAFGVKDKKSGTATATAVKKSAEKWLNSKTKNESSQLYFWEQLERDAKKHGGKYYKSIKKYVAKKESELAKSHATAAKKRISKIGTYDDAAISRQVSAWNTEIQAAKKHGKKYTETLKKQAQGEINALREIQNTRREYAVGSGPLDAYKTYFKTSLRAEKEYWASIRKTRGLSYDQQLQADQSYNDAAKEYEDAKTEAREDYAEKEKEINDNLKNDITDLEKTYTDAVKSTTDSIMSAYDLFDTFLSESVSGKQLLENARMQAWGYSEWEEDLDTLRKKFSDMNLSNDLLNEIVEKGPKAAAQVKALTQLDPSELQEYSALYEQKTKIATEEAKKQNDALKRDTERQIADLKKTADEELKKAMDNYKKTIAEIEMPMSDGLRRIANNAASWAESTIVSYAQNLAKTARNPQIWTDATNAIQSAVKSATSGSIKKTTTTTTATKGSSTKTTKAKQTYYKKYTGKNDDWEEVIKKRSGKLSKSKAKEIAKLNGVSNYSGKKSQKKKLMDLLRRGKLKKPHKMGGFVSSIIPFWAANGDDGVTSVQVGEMILPRKFSADIVPRFTRSVETITDVLDKFPSSDRLNRLVEAGTQTIIVNQTNKNSDKKLNMVFDMIIEYLPYMEYVKTVSDKAGRSVSVADIMDGITGRVSESMADNFNRMMRR